MSNFRSEFIRSSIVIVLLAVIFVLLMTIGEGLHDAFHDHQDQVKEVGSLSAT